METYLEASPGLLKASSIALGFFDGVHPGHQAVITKAIEEATRLSVPCGVVTFRDHPRTLTTGRAPLLLTVIEQRLALFESMGVDFTLALQFTEELCRLSPRQYVESVLVGSLGARAISVGHNHHFGRDREGDASLLAELGESLGFVVNAADMISVDGQEVSSSRIRELLAMGQMEQASRLLSRPFALSGTIETGDRRGRELGFPTANLSVYPYQMIPKRGVYFGLARIEQGSGLSDDIPAVINLGLRPTFIEADSAIDQRAQTKIEAHLLDFEGDIYGRKMELSFHSYLREERKFSGMSELKEQIARDIEQARIKLTGTRSCSKDATLEIKSHPDSDSNLRERPSKLPA